MGKILLEAPVFSIEAALLAEAYGIDRIELCSNFEVGGETPSAGALQFLKQNLSLPIFVMIRPRGGDFVYTEEEISVMKEDIRILRNLGADGFVFGVLSPEGELDMNINKSLINCAGGLPCTLHRAFDSTFDLIATLEDAISCGFQRILTSGGKNMVSEGMDTLLSLLQRAGERITIMPGGGLKPENLPDLYNSQNLREVHASCKGWRPSKAKFRKSKLELTGDENIITINKTSVSEFQKKLAILSEIA